MDKQREEFEKWVVFNGMGLYIYTNLSKYADSDTEAAWQAWQAAKAKAIPEGFVLVPKEQTPKMIDATWNFDEEIQDMSHNSRNEFIYNAMIAAAQEPTNESE